ncbi:MAG: bifunctional folylpolyglutamate synthase/dihydrofolate synthase [Bacteroides sp.]|nr:bifunctional folylpolyglutamate synthase/dihydrofolate synthase [Bacteroides sp.]
MDYQETLTYLYNSVPLYQQVGNQAYKEGLSNTIALDDYLHHPHTSYQTIHVAGTNGKGSCSHTLAAVLQEAGYKTGLYTSPHLLDFRERIRINGKPVSEEFVIGFVEKHRDFFEPLHPSFFELTTALAFRYFADEQVDVAIIEVGLGGRLDCTNIIDPDLCVITNISPDHTQLLGETPEKIAWEKAGIIKPYTPVVIGESTTETKPVFLSKANEVCAPILFAEEHPLIIQAIPAEHAEEGWIYETSVYGRLYGELGGSYQQKNSNTVLHALQVLQKSGYHIPVEAIRRGFSQVCELTGLMGRWQKLKTYPTILCDTGHNLGGFTYIVEQLQKQSYRKLHIVLGMVEDKDVTKILKLLPEKATYYFTRASVQRALPADQLLSMAQETGLQGKSYPDVPTAVKEALRNSLPEDLIFVGGSTFVVVDLLAHRNTLDLY